MRNLAERLQAHLSERYRIERVLGTGGMATVLLAWDRRQERAVALKVLNPEVASAIGPERFLREVALAGRLQHPHILPVFDSGQAGTLLYYAMPHVEGESLRGRLDRERQLPVSVAVRLARELAEALHHAHRHGVVHRDLKPENVLLSDGLALLADFGVARALESSGGTKLTSTGVVLGTPAYMSPEQLTGGAVDPRSDVYALGCLLHEMVAGRPPFVAPNTEGLAYQHLSAAPPPLSSLRPGTPPWLEEVVTRALAKSPADRFATALEMAQALERGGTAAAEPARQRAGEGRRVAVLVMTTVLALLALPPAVKGILSWLRPPGEIESVAVLPLANLSGDPAQLYFADGMTEELIAELSRIRALRVISRTSVMRYRSGTESLGEIARELGVDAVVEGSVMREGGRVRITAKLIEARGERHLWSSRYERELGDALTLQGELARAIAEQVRTELTPGERQRLAERRPVRPEAFDAYLRGRQLSDRATEASLRAAVAEYQKAIGLDPLFAAAWGGLADAWYRMSSIYMPATVAMPLVRRTAQRALELDPDLGSAHALLGTVHSLYDFDWRSGEAEFLRALALSPSDANAHLYYGQALVTQGRFDESLRQYELAAQLDPHSLYIRIGRTIPLSFAGRCEEVEATLGGIQARDSTLAAPYLSLLVCRMGKADYSTAVVAGRAALRHNNEPNTKSLLACALASASARGESEVLLRELEASGSAPQRLYLAKIHCWLGHTDVALDLLEQSYAAREEEVAMLRHDPLLRPLRGHPRFEALARRIGV